MISVNIGQFSTLELIFLNATCWKVVLNQRVFLWQVETTYVLFQVGIQPKIEFNKFYNFQSPFHVQLMDSVALETMIQMLWIPSMWTTIKFVEVFKSFFLAAKMQHFLQVLMSVIKVNFITLVHQPSFTQRDNPWKFNYT